MNIYYGYLDNEKDNTSPIGEECIEDIIKYGIICDYCPEINSIYFYTNWGGVFAGSDTVAIFKVKQLKTN